MVSADVVEGQIATATGALQWLQAQAEKTRRATAISPLVIFITYVLGLVLRKIEKEGVSRFDPEYAGEAADKFLEVSNMIQRLIARSDQTGLFDHFPSNLWFPKLQQQGKELFRLVAPLRAIDERWQAAIAEAAQEQIDKYRKAPTIAPTEAEEVEVFTSTQESCHSPSEEATRAHLRRVLSSPEK